MIELLLTLAVCVYSDINECEDPSTAAGPPCDPGTVCVNVPGSYLCSDPSSVSCEDVDPTSGQCLGVRSARSRCRPGMRFNSTAERCVGKITTVVWHVSWYV